MLCTLPDDPGPHYLYRDGALDIVDQVFDAALAVYGDPYTIGKWEEITHIFHYLDILLPGLRVFHVWLQSGECPHRTPCQWLTQVYVIDHDNVVLAPPDIYRVHFREVLALLKGKQKERASIDSSTLSSVVRLGSGLNP